MMTAKDKQFYFEYRPSEGGTWWKKETPIVEPFFQQGLIEVAGLNPFGEPNLKISWAGTLLHDYTEQPQLKYKLTARRIVGYYYKKTDGTIGQCRSMNQATDAALPWQYHPNYREMELGRLRWVIEEWESPESLRAKGRFTKLHDANGVKVLRDLPPKGVYNHYFWIQSANRKYREPDMQVLEAIKAMYLYEVNTSDAQKFLDWIEQENDQALVGANEANEIWAQMAHE